MIEKITWQRVFHIPEWNNKVDEFVKYISTSGDGKTRYEAEFMAHHPHKSFGHYTFLVNEKCVAGGSPFTRNQIEAKYGVKE